VRGDPLILRAPASTRPWQHVLEPLAGYLRYAEALAAGREVPRALNFGPEAGSGVTVAALASQMAAALGVDRPWHVAPDAASFEAKSLAIDPALAAQHLGWRARLDAAETVAWTARWYEAHRRGREARSLCLAQIGDYEALA